MLLASILATRRIFRRHMHLLHLAPGARILDIGCGTGSLALFLARMGYSVEGVDSSEGMLARARRKAAGTAVPFVRGDAAAGLPVKDGSFDLVLMAHVLHGHRPAARRAILREARRVSRGLVLVQDYPPFPGMRGMDSLIVRFMEILERSDYGSFIRHSAAEMREEFDSVSIVRVHGDIAWYICRSRT